MGSQAAVQHRGAAADADRASAGSGRSSAKDGAPPENVQAR
jgi:hypothetical protein